MPRRKTKPLANLPLVQLREMVAQREQVLQRLQAREVSLEKELAGVRGEIAAIVGRRGPGRPPMLPPGVAAPKRRGRRGRGVGGKTVAAAIADILVEKGQPMRVGEMATAFRKLNHPTRSKNLEKLIAITIKGSNRFRRVGRGLYTAT